MNFFSVNTKILRPRISRTRAGQSATLGADWGALPSRTESVQRIVSIRFVCRTFAKWTFCLMCGPIIAVYRFVWSVGSEQFENCGDFALRREKKESLFSFWLLNPFPRRSEPSSKRARHLCENAIKSYLVSNKTLSRYATADARLKTLFVGLFAGLF